MLITAHGVEHAPALPSRPGVAPPRPLLQRRPSRHGSDAPRAPDRPSRERTTAPIGTDAPRAGAIRPVVEFGRCDRCASTPTSSSRSAGAMSRLGQPRQPFMLAARGYLGSRSASSIEASRTGRQRCLCSPDRSPAAWRHPEREQPGHRSRLTTSARTMAACERPSPSASRWTSAQSSTLCTPRPSSAWAVARSRVPANSHGCSGFARRRHFCIRRGPRPCRRTKVLPPVDLSATCAQGRPKATLATLNAKSGRRGERWANA